ncbi:Hypothetical protein A7982_00784 [Minicystis rosea]|nr:Hypothetical protein A7982_00784 [Minicystis rosea]
MGSLFGLFPGEGRAFHLGGECRESGRPLARRRGRRGVGLGGEGDDEIGEVAVPREEGTADVVEGERSFHAARENRKVGPETEPRNSPSCPISGLIPIAESRRRGRGARPARRIGIEISNLERRYPSPRHEFPPFRATWAQSGTKVLSTSRAEPYHLHGRIRTGCESTLDPKGSRVSIDSKWRFALLAGWSPGTGES